MRERQLSKLPTEVGGICIDFLEAVLAGLTEEGLLPRDRLAAFQQYKAIHYENTNAATWRKMKLVNGWEDGRWHWNDGVTRNGGWVFGWAREERDSNPDLIPINLKP